MTYIGAKFVQQIPSLFIPVGEFAKKALVILPGKIKGNKGEEQRNAQEH